MALTAEQTDGLWGDGGPYSQVQVIRQVRILDEHVTRIFYYVKANVNPTTYETLKAMQDRIEDQEILAFLREAAFVSQDDGYEWAVYGKEAATPSGANRAARQAADAIVRMHKMVMAALEIRPPEPAVSPEAGPAEPLPGQE